MAQPTRPCKKLRCNSICIPRPTPQILPPIHREGKPSALPKAILRSLVISAILEIVKARSWNYLSRILEPTL